MKQVFLDSDVVLDFLTKREPFVLESMHIFEFAARKELKIYVSSLSINNIHYIVSKLESAEKSKKQIRILLNLVEILPVAKSTIEKAFLSDFSDFEDALQNFCAEEGGLNILITRNVRDYKRSQLSIFTPKEFLSDFVKENK